MRKALAALLALLVLAGAGGALWWFVVGEQQARQRDAAETADAFLAAWTDGDWAALAARVAPAQRSLARARHEEAFAGIEVEAFVAEPLSVHVDGEVADASYRAHLDVAGLGRHTYEGAFALSWTDGAWAVQWSPRVVHPAMVEGGAFQAARSWPERAPILDRDGTPLAGADEETVAVGIEPRRITDPELAIDALVTHAGANRARVEALLARDDLVDDWFYPVAEMPRSLFEEADAELRPVPGIVFRAGSGERAHGGGFAIGLLGRTGEASAEQAAELGPPYEEGDVVGLYGLEAGLEEQLAGRPHLRLTIVDGGGDDVATVMEVDGTEPQAARVTLDRTVQRAAEQAIAEDGPPAAIVAVDVPSGDVLAAANRPVSGFNRAFEGRYPPGSTFKVVTASALLAAGLAADDTVDCPETVQVGGRAFRNAAGLALGEITLREAFARSCNTAFAGQAPGLGDALADAATTFGFDGRTWLAVPSFGGSYPEPVDTTALAAAAIGQGRVEASPLHMATVAAAAARGAWLPPRLVLGEGDEAEQPRALPGDVAALRELLLEAVRAGTGVAAALPGEPVAGKTGSAEFGTASPPETHAWFIGFRGEVAFAVLVEGGGAGSEVAAPLARTFLEALD